jgi:putative copper resistance protein D
MFWMMIVWIHILAAMFWVGGMIFFASVLIPSLKGVPAELRTALVSRIGKRYRTAGWTALGVLLVTGLLNLLHRGIPLQAYGPAFRAKLFLIAATLALTLLHDLVLGPKSIRVSRAAAAPHPLQKIVRLLARLNLVVGLLIILAAVYLVRGG